MLRMNLPSNAAQLALATLTYLICQAASDHADRTKNAQPASLDASGDPLPEYALARFGTTRFRHEWTIYASAISPDGRILAGGGNQTVQLWDAQTGKSLHRVPGHGNGVQALAFAPDGKLVASYDHDMKLRFIDTGTGKVVREFDRKNELWGNSFSPAYLEFLPDGNALLLKDGREPAVRLLDAENGKELRKFQSVGKHVYGVALSPDGKSLAVGEESGTVRVWNVATGLEHLEIKKHTRRCLTLAFSPDGKQLASGGESADAYVWEATTGKLLFTLDAGVEVSVAIPGTGKKGLRRLNPGAARSLKYAPDGKSLLACYSYLVKFWDSTTGKELRHFHHPAGASVRFMPDGKTLLAGGTRDSYSSTLAILDATTGQPCRGSDGHTGRVEAIAFSPDAKHIATADEGGEAAVRVWDAGSGRVVFHDAQRRGTAKAVAFNPQGDTLAAGYGQKVVLFDWKAGKALQTLAGHAHVHVALAYSPDGLRLASAGYDGSIKLWDLGSGKELQSFSVEDGILWAAAFSPDLRLLASADQNKSTIHIWDLATGKAWNTFEREGQGGIRLTFSPDSRTLLELSGGNRLALWEVATGQSRIGRILPPPTPIWSVAYSPDGRSIGLGALELFHQRDKARATHVPLVVFHLPKVFLTVGHAGHEASVNALSFSPDSQRLASGSTDTTALLWDVAALKASLPPLTLSAEQRVACWADLAGSAGNAFKSMWKLVEDGGTVEFLRKELPAATAPPDAKVTAALITDLDSNQFAIRARAQEALTRGDPAAMAELRKVLAGQPSAELRRTAHSIIQSLEGRQMQRIRGVEVLELINTDVARKLLEALSKGAADAPLTREAKGSLERLRRRPTRVS